MSLITDKPPWLVYKSGRKCTMVLPVAKSVFDVHYANRRTSLVMEADLDRGWIKHKSTYGFFHQMRIPHHDDYTIRAQLQVIPHPCGFDLCWQEFPDIDISAEKNSWACQVHGKQLALKVSLSPHQPWRTTPQGRPELFINWVPMWDDGRLQYDLQAWIVFHDGSRRPVPDVRVWTENNLVVPGGQFESNRQHH